MGYISPNNIISEITLDNKFPFYISHTEFALSKFPYVHNIGEAHHTKFSDYTCIRASGNKITEGFKVDQECVKESLPQIKAEMQKEGFMLD